MDIHLVLSVISYRDGKASGGGQSSVMAFLDTAMCQAFDNTRSTTAEKHDKFETGRFFRVTTNSKQEATLSCPGHADFWMFWGLFTCKV